MNAETVYRCPGCGRQYRNPLELVDVRSWGLALVGKCPVCGTLCWLNSLWKKREEKTKTRTRMPQVKK